MKKKYEKLESIIKWKYDPNFKDYNLAAEILPGTKPTRNIYRGYIR